MNLSDRWGGEAAEVVDEWDTITMRRAQEAIPAQDAWSTIENRRAAESVFSSESRTGSNPLGPTSDDAWTRIESRRAAETAPVSHAKIEWPLVLLGAGLVLYFLNTLNNERAPT